MTRQNASKTTVINPNLKVTAYEKPGKNGHSFVIEYGNGNRLEPGHAYFNYDHTGPGLLIFETTKGPLLGDRFVDFKKKMQNINKWDGYRPHYRDWEDYYRVEMKLNNADSNIDRIKAELVVLFSNKYLEMLEEIQTNPALANAMQGSESHRIDQIKNVLVSVRTRPEYANYVYE